MNTWRVARTALPRTLSSRNVAKNGICMRKFMQAQQVMSTATALPSVQLSRKISSIPSTHATKSLISHYSTSAAEHSPTNCSTNASFYTTLSTPPSIVATHFDLSKIPAAEHAQITHDFIIVPNYLSPQEHDMMVEAATKKLKRALGKQVRYEDGHFDGVITRYRECSASDWGAPPSLSSQGAEQKERQTPSEVLQAIKLHYFPQDWKWVAPHILELEAGKGGIKPHVDHLEASGQVVAGICLGSTAVMELIHDKDPSKSFRVLLPKGCFYFQRDSVRYQYKHGIPIELEDHQFKGTVYPKEKRISVMLRNALEPARHNGH
ncbi:Alpha-ketoglutarate-dependent dioxygenase alkB 7, mitochondrial [Podila verticillata]|nr:Alpha-ketoglutarate-dependent dioxygenase alkB 7, mitochondrial [Podila verticillata]